MENSTLTFASARPYARQAALTALTALALGCSRDHAAQTTETYGALSRALCEQLLSCGLADFERVEDCTGESGLFCSDLHLDMPIEGAAKCVQALRRLSCSEFEEHSGPPPECEGPLALMESAEGAALLGESCTLNAGCVDGLYCAASSGSCGLCKALPEAGEACARGACRIGHFCSERDRCEPEKRTGDSCEDESECQTQVCKAEKCVEPALVREGETCELRFDRCEPGTVCAGGSCRARASLGEPCVGGECYFGLVCEEGSCVEVSGCGMGQEGDLCISNEHCGQGLGCDWIQQRCRPSENGLELGAVCKTDSSCLSGLCFQGECADPARVCD